MFMAPEMFVMQANDYYDGVKADIFALGVVFFLLRTGFMPYTEIAHAGYDQLYT